MYLCISTVVDFNSQNFDPLMKFDKYSPERNDDGAGGDLSKLSADVEKECCWLSPAARPM